MLIKDVLKIAAGTLGLETDSGGLAVNHGERSCLLDCAAAAYAEIVSEYFPLIYDEDIRFNSHGRAFFGNFSKRFFRALRVSLGGLDVAYTAFHDSLRAEVRNADVRVRYEYIPPELQDEYGEIEIDAAVTERILALGIVAEYCLRNGRFEESALYDKKYKDSMLAVSRKKSRIDIKKRSWLK